jgi:gas vesicle protein GvpL/GvpF
MGAHVDVMTRSGTYVYCIVADTKRPKPPRTRAGLAGLGAVRLLPIIWNSRSTAGTSGSPRPRRGLDMWAVVADAPLKEYGEQAINRGLTDLNWVSRAAVAHEAIVESFSAAPAVLPMKLFTIFTSDERVLEHFARERLQIQTLLARVRNHEEWGIRVVLDRARAVAGPDRGAARKDSTSGAGYLQRKKAQQEASAELAQRSRDMMADLYDRFARDATLAKRRTANELPAQGGPLLLDAAFLVPRSRSARFRSLVDRKTQALAPQGYGITLSGPWPPYTFMQD